MGTTFSSKIHSALYPNVMWIKGNKDYILKTTDVHVWSIKVPDNFCDLFKEYRFVLNQEELYKAKAFYWEKDFRSYLTGRIVLRILLSKYLSQSINDIRFDQKSKKPGIISQTPLKYNLSYAGTHILISIGLCETGIDIENVKQNFDFQDLLAACFSKEEINFIDKNQESSRQEFFLQWTRKEALLKYTGQGIIDDLTSIPSLNGIHHSINEKLEIKMDTNLLSFHLNSDCVGSLAYPNTVSTVKYFEWL